MELQGQGHSQREPDIAASCWADPPECRVHTHQASSVHYWYEAMATHSDSVAWAECIRKRGRWWLVML